MSDNTPSGPPPGSHQHEYADHYHGPSSPTPAPQGTARGRGGRRTGLAAAVVATSLVVGGGAGVGGAAVWDLTHDGAASTSTTRTTDSAPVPGSSTRADTASQTRGADGSVEEVAKSVLPSVVRIDVAGAQGAGSGSGIVLTADGTILTNNHVVEVAGNDGSITVDFTDGSTAEAKVVGTDPLTDTAVIKAEGVSELAPATIGNSGELGVGQDVVAVGSPYGLDATVTSGIVSALDRPVNFGSDIAGNSTTYPAIQTDAAINPGNSGGPLVDMTGAVVGINSSIRTASSDSAFGQGGQGGSIGLGFAIPIDEVMPIVDQMTNGEQPTHARLGIQVGATPEGSAGAAVREVGQGSTAASGGLANGDVITKIDDMRIADADALVATIRSYRPGDIVTVTWLRDSKEHSGDFTLDSDGAQT